MSLRIRWLDSSPTFPKVSYSSFDFVFSNAFVVSNEEVRGSGDFKKFLTETRTFVQTLGKIRKTSFLFFAKGGEGEFWEKK